MPQLNFYVPQSTADELKRRAKVRKLPVSRYIAEIVSKDVRTGWPPGYFESFAGKWIGDLERPDQGVLEEIEPLNL
ncbi:MAG: hypothetical protein NTV70_04455 [Acidobacteria bacterium]|nr:hypothetical protein [Acidobacteriota bacterium]